jgi:hypothetical protein
MNAKRPALVAALIATWIAGCAAGAPERFEVEEGPLGEPSLPRAPMLPEPPGAMAGASASPPDAGPPAAAPLDAGPPAVPVGDPCMRDEVEPCVCLALGTMGERRCLYDRDSPRDGFFSACQRCADPEAVDPPVAGSGSDSMNAGAGGMMNAGAGGATNAGTGSGAPAPPPPPAGTGCLANPATCGDRLLQCCRQDGTCGLGLPGVLCL